jgi:alanine dehydrogenase
MLIGVPKEIKNHEYRVGMTPVSVQECVSHGHKVMIETNAGAEVGFNDAQYVAAGATIANTPQEIFAAADMIVKVKEPQHSEFALIRKGQIIFTYLHLAAEPELAKALCESGCVGIAYETVTDRDGSLPLLTPMSQVAGRLSIQAGARCLEKPNGGSGVLLGGVPGVPPGNVTIIGGGVVGTNAARMAMGKEAHVTVLDTSLPRLQQLDSEFGSRLNTIYSTKASIEKYVIQADLVIGAVLVPGGAAPTLVTRDMLSKMQPGSVMVDVAIDQGGCFATSKPTSHENPTYVVDGVVHYCVTNMPGAVPRTATWALTNATLPFVLKLANLGYKKALSIDKHLYRGLNVYDGSITYEAVSKHLGLPYKDCSSIFA